MNKNGVFFLIGVILFVVVGIFLKRDSFKVQKSSGKIQAATSFYPLYFFTDQIARDKAEIHNITPAGVEPHDYEPTPQDITWIESSDLLIINGANLEVWYEQIKDQLQEKNVKVIIAADQIANQQVDEGGKTTFDPHIWLSPSLAKKEVEHILKGFINVDPKEADYYQNRAKELLAELDNLDKEYREGLTNCKQNDIVTSHAAFGYVAKTYGFHQVSVTGISPDAEPSAQQVAEIAKFAKERKIKYIFFESLVSPKLSETIANEVGAQTLVLDPIEGITEEDMKKGKNYFTIMRDNLTNLQTALECE